MALIATNKNDINQSLGFDVSNPSKYDNVPNFDALPDLNDWMGVSILTLDWAAALYAGVDPNSRAVETRCFDTVYQSSKAEVILKAMMADIALGNLDALSVTIIREQHDHNGDYVWEESISVSDVSSEHLHCIQTSKTTIKNSTFLAWLKRKNLKSVRMLSLEKARYEKWKQQQIQTHAFVDSLKAAPMKNQALLGFSYTTPALELVALHIDENLNGAPQDYLNDLKSQKDFVYRSGRAVGLSDNECQAVYTVTRAPSAKNKFIKSPPTQGKSTEK